MRRRSALLLVACSLLSATAAAQDEQQQPNYYAACGGAIQRLYTFCGQDPPLSLGPANIAAGCAQSNSDVVTFCGAAGGQAACEGAIHRMKVWCAQRPLLGNPMVPYNPATAAASCQQANFDIQNLCR